MSLVSRFVGEPSRFLSAESWPLWLLLGVGGALGLIGTAAFTELGQVLDMPRDWVVWLYQHKTGVNLVLILCLGLFLLINRSKGRPFNRLFAGLFGVAILACLFFINLFAPDVWLRSQQHTAEYVSVAEADGRLDDEADVFVLVIGNEARAYPRDWMQVPHIAGDEIGDENVTMTYCALSNLPLAFDSELGGEETDLRVITQVSNNLLFADRNSGELVQQIQATTEFSDEPLAQHPVQRMPWRSFKALYPGGKVFNYQPNALDRLTMNLFELSLEDHYQGEALFPTLRMDDHRLDSGEQVWGLNINGKQLAVTRAAMEAQPIRSVSLGGREVVLAWYPDYGMLGAFYTAPGLLPGSIIDPYGRAENGIVLERANLYSGVFWMVWSHWFPDTGVL